MSGKCVDCKVPYQQYMATSFANEEGIFQTKRYYKCPKCDTIYIESLTPFDDDYTGEVIHTEIIRPRKPVTLDQWK